jgi:hypothetical protein
MHKVCETKQNETDQPAVVVGLMPERPVHDALCDGEIMAVYNRSIMLLRFRIRRALMLEMGSLSGSSGKGGSSSMGARSSAARATSF